MSEPVHIAAIDAGSNAVRLSVARAYSALDIEPVQTERYSLRLGESVFLSGRFSEELLQRGVKAFRHIREVMDDYGVTRYRAVATSASREAKNRNAFVRRIRQKTGVRLEVIGAAEESRLGREAVLAALGPESSPRCVADLGGGSLELSFLRDHTLERTAQLGLGAVRLMTTLNLPGAIRPAQAEQVRRYVRALLESRLPDRLKRDVRERMRVYAVRRDRADVMAVAAIVLIALGRYLNVRDFVIPGVGIREGLLQEIARDAFSRKEPHRYNAAARQLLAGARSFARRLDYDPTHAEHVRELSVMLFDQLQPLHHLSSQARVLLEAGALLHDIGHRVSHRGHHKHGEYLVLNGDIPGLAGRDRGMVAALVRYHNRKGEPSENHRAYSELSNADKRTARRLAGILRVAEALDHSHRQHAREIQASFQRGTVGLQVSARGEAAGDLRSAAKSAELFEREFHVRLHLRQAAAK